MSSVSAGSAPVKRFMRSNSFCSLSGSSLPPLVQSIGGWFLAARDAFNFSLLARPASSAVLRSSSFFWVSALEAWRFADEARSSKGFAFRVGLRGGLAS